MSFNIALTGLNAANQDLDVTANNLANAQTVGFKGSRTEFADLYASTQAGVSATTAGNGVAVSEIAQQFTQGNIETTGNNLDLAINGNGFFTVSQDGSLQYTRDGEFQLNSSGDVVTASGQNLQVYPPLSNGNFNTGGLQNLVLNTGEGAPAATTTASLTANLPADATPPADAANFSPTDPNSYNDTTSLTVYDSLGAAHTATMYFTNTGAGTWNAYMYVDGQPVNPDANGVATPQTLTYNSATGTLDATTSTNAADTTGTVNFGSYQPATGASPLNIEVNLLNTTQYGGNFDVTAVDQNGYTTGQLTGISIGSTGIVQAQYTNGQAVNLGQVAMANFANPQGLQQLGNSSWSQTDTSGAPVMGTAGSSSFGSIESGSLEESNVDTTSELVNMITAQRAFQANAQAIQTNDQITQTIIQMTQSG